MFFGGVLSIRRIRGWVGAEPKRPQAFAWGYPEPLLRSSIRMARRGRRVRYPLQPQLRSSPVTHDTAKGNVLVYFVSIRGSFFVTDRPFTLVVIRARQRRYSSGYNRR